MIAIVVDNCHFTHAEAVLDLLFTDMKLVAEHRLLVFNIRLALILRVHRKKDFGEILGQGLRRSDSESPFGLHIHEGLAV